MLNRRYTTMAWDQMATRLPFSSGKMEIDNLTKGITPESLNWPKHAKNWFFVHGGRLDLETRKLVHGPKLKRATQRFSYALHAKVIGAFRPNREKDELTYAIGTAEHSG